MSDGIQYVARKREVELWDFGLKHEFFAKLTRYLIVAIQATCAEDELTLSAKGLRIHCLGRVLQQIDQAATQDPPVINLRAHVLDDTGLLELLDQCIHNAFHSLGTQGDFWLAGRQSDSADAPRSKASFN